MVFKVSCTQCKSAYNNLKRNAPNSYKVMELTTSADIIVWACLSNCLPSLNHLYKCFKIYGGGRTFSGSKKKKTVERLEENIFLKRCNGANIINILMVLAPNNGTRSSSKYIDIMSRLTQKASLARSSYWMNNAMNNSFSFSQRENDGTNMDQSTKITIV